MARFDERVAVVTGAASGIGEAVVRRLVAEGAQVIGGDLSAERLQALAGDLGAAFRGVVTDVTVESDVEAMVATATDAWGRLDLAFNVAGGARPGPIVDLTEADWDATVDLVLKGVFLSVKHEARVMRAAGGGAVVNVSSLNAHVPMRGGGSYAAGKGGVEMLTRTAALELAEDGIRVNSVLPGLVRTPGTAAVFDRPRVHEAFLARIPLGRAADPDEVAGPCLYLASDDARYVTGTALVVDGGWEITGYPDVRALGS
ncbi:SDR family NAD(P)-dependent oxidoreductase [Trujillonella endophytica]|uniref:NAD(P)-dependent dehydrogenase, short-chain alcohol dehydrogenase family n=1 Tax=Trujillonella endophytica TaxID=673521 RepID=A0A1H8Q520_9ACTN|nr:SDR family NAD(P)-dependent oxidoreductase [Trujillella endophytica]SEO48863.1 NAD(P)-dependent dehydrogenase, short-chain alcohol dehydrogenase family [Trujillella endophytica]